MEEYTDYERRIGLSVLYNILSRYGDKKFEKNIDRKILVKLFSNPPYKRVPKEIKGKIRPLDIPSKKLMIVLQAVLHNILYDFPVSSSAHAAVAGRSIVTNARRHLGSKSFFQLDFKDYFPSIATQTVVDCLEGLFEQSRQIDSFKNCGLITWRHSRALAKVIGHLTTFRNSLPQGAPTSSYLQNLVLFNLDESIYKLARKFGLIYTRFVDDIIISSRRSRIFREDRVKIVNFIKELAGDILKLNRKKVHYRTGEARVMNITGITIVPTEDGRIRLSLPKRKIERFRAIIHQASLKGVLTKKERARIWGIIGLVTMVTGEIPVRIREPFKRFLEVHYPEGYPDNFDHYDNLHKT